MKSLGRLPGKSEKKKILGLLVPPSLISFPLHMLEHVCAGELNREVLQEGLALEGVRKRDLVSTIGFCSLSKVSSASPHHGHCKRANVPPFAHCKGWGELCI